MPAPEAAIGGRFYTYLGRMPAGTLLQIVSAERDNRKIRKSRIRYRVIPLSPINDRIKGNISWTVHEPNEPLEQQIFSLSSVGVGQGIYGEESYSNGAPKLNEIWFEIINIDEQL